MPDGAADWPLEARVSTVASRADRAALRDHIGGRVGIPYDPERGSPGYLTARELAAIALALEGVEPGGETTTAAEGGEQ